MPPTKNHALLLGMILEVVLLGVAAACLAQGKEHAMPKPRGELAQAGSFVFVAEIGGMVGGSAARSCTAYLADSGLLQEADEETDGTLHDLRSGQGNARTLLRKLPLVVPGHPAGKNQRQPLPEYYSPKLAITWLTARGGYRFVSFEAAAAPPEIADFARRAKSAVRAGDLRSAPPGLYARARRQLNFDPEIESLRATVSTRQLGSLPLLSELIAREMALIRLGPPGAPASLAKDLRISPGRALRIKVGNLVYIVQAYEFRGPDEAGRAPCRNPAPLHVKGEE